MVSLSNQSPGVAFRQTQGPEFNQRAQGRDLIVPHPQGHFLLSFCDGDLT
jgi:hypothetical protein